MSEEREHNQVFTGVPGGPKNVDPRIQAVSAASQVKSDFGIEIPIETVPLPSAGKVYPVNSPLHDRETVDIRAMTAREEDVLTSKAYLKSGVVITELIRSCLVDKSIDPVDMLNGDRNALMVAIRITGYGADYDVEVDCDECDEKTPRSFNLGELEIRRLTISPVQPGMNLFEFTLPYTKKTVRFKFLTGRDEDDIMSSARKQKKLQLSTAETGITTNLLYSIVAIDGVDDRGKIAGFVRMMPARDSLALREYIRQNEPGIIMRQDVKCPRCGREEEVAMPMAASFLWPNARR
jgi:hypothetical protein